MLSPDSRAVAIDFLRPPAGYALDAAVLTTFSLDLEALLALPLAVLAHADGGVDEVLAGPLLLLEALRQAGDRVHVFVDQAGIAIPRAERSLYAMLEASVHPVRAPNEGAFHPKVWLARFRCEDEPPLIRVAVLSRNLTFDRSWDIALTSEAIPAGKRRQRQSRALDLMIHGRSHAEISAILAVAESTVASHAKRALQKIGLRRREQAIVVAAALSRAALETREDGGHAGSGEPPRGLGAAARDGAVHRVTLDAALMACLTPAQREVCLLIVEGLSNAEISGRRSVSVHTTANHIVSVFRRLGVGSRGELAAKLLGVAPELGERAALQTGSDAPPAGAGPFSFRACCRSWGGERRSGPARERTGARAAPALQPAVDSGRRALCRAPTGAAHRGGRPLPPGGGDAQRPPGERRLGGPRI